MVLAIEAKSEKDPGSLSLRASFVRLSSKVEGTHEANITHKQQLACSRTLYIKEATIESSSLMNPSQHKVFTFLRK